MLVPSLMALVAADARARAISGSPMSDMDGGMEPSGVPPYLELVWTGTMGCSGSQNDSNPSSSARFASSAGSTESLEALAVTPISMINASVNMIARWYHQGAYPHH